MCRGDNLTTFICRMSRYCRSLNFLEPLGLGQVCNRTVTFHDSITLKCQWRNCDCCAVCIPHTVGYTITDSSVPSPFPPCVPVRPLWAPFAKFCLLVVHATDIFCELLSLLIGTLNSKFKCAKFAQFCLRVWVGDLGAHDDVVGVFLCADSRQVSVPRDSKTDSNPARNQTQNGWIFA